MHYPRRRIPLKRAILDARSQHDDFNYYLSDDAPYNLYMLLAAPQGRPRRWLAQKFRELVRNHLPENCC